MPKKQKPQRGRPEERVKIQGDWRKAVKRLFGRDDVRRRAKAK